MRYAVDGMYDKGEKPVKKQERAEKRPRRPAKEKRSPLRRFTLVLSWVLLTWALLPLVNGIFGIGVALPAAVAVAGIFWSLRRPKKKTETKKGWGKAMTVVGIAGICIVAGAAILLSALMIGSAVKQPVEGSTVIVLGSKIYGDRPSRMMAGRLKAAAAYLQAHPDSNCVVSGGLGEGETYTEAYVMQKYLVEELEIAPERIALEERSTNTQENIHFSMEIIREQGWSEDVTVATQVFHQYRAAQWVRRAGAHSVGGAACLTPPHLMLYYWVRECAAICRLWLLGI